MSGFRKMRRFKQELEKDECVEILNNEKRGFLSVLGDDDYPYVLPMNFIYLNDSVYFHSAKEGHKIDSIKNHPKASFSVINQGEKQVNNWWYKVKSVIVFGKISLIDSDDLTLEVLKKLGDKYFPSKEYTENEIKRFFDNVQCIRLEIENMTGKMVREK